MRLGRCIVCGAQFEVDDGELAISETTGEQITVPNRDGPWWMHAGDGVEASVCREIHSTDEIVAAHRLLTTSGAVVPAR